MKKNLAKSKVQETAMKLEEIINEEVKLFEIKKKAAQDVLDAEQELLETVKDHKEKIDALCEDAGLFCGLVLTRNDILNIISLAIDSKEEIRVPYNLYFN